MRAKAYLPIGDQLDAVMKLADAMLDQGMPLPTEVQSWVENCKAVKAKYKKT